MSRYKGIGGQVNKAGNINNSASGSGSGFGSGSQASSSSSFSGWFQKKAKKNKTLQAMQDYPYYEQLLSRESPELTFNTVHGYGKAAICSVNTKGYNEAFICACGGQNFINLYDDIGIWVEACRTEGLTMQYWPYVGAIVIAAWEPLFTDHGSTGEYHRAVIRQLISKDVAILEFIDVGIKKQRSLYKVYPLTEDILRHPVLGYKVKIHGVHVPKRMFFLDEYNRQIDEIRRTIVRVNVLQVDQFENITTSIYVCVDKLSLNIDNNTPRIPLQGQSSSSGYYVEFATIINSLQMWPWLDTLRGEAIEGESDLFVNQLLNGERLKMNCDRMLPPMFAANTKGSFYLPNDYPHVALGTAGCIFLQSYDIEDDMYRDRKEILGLQIDKYIQYLDTHRVEYSYFPGVKEIFLMYIKVPLNKSAGIGMSGIGKWNRCYRRSIDWILNLDTQEDLPTNPSDYNKLKGVVSYLFRPAPFEFFQCVSVLPLHIYMPEFTGVNYEEVDYLYKKDPLLRTPFPFKITECKPSGFHIMECEKFKHIADTLGWFDKSKPGEAKTGADTLGWFDKSKPGEAKTGADTQGWFDKSKPAEAKTVVHSPDTPNLGQGDQASASISTGKQKKDSVFTDQLTLKKDASVSTDDFEEMAGNFVLDEIVEGLKQM